MTEKRKAGRPTKFNEDVAQKILAAVELGAYRKTAAKNAGVPYRTLVQWLTDAKKRPRSELGRFRAALDEAESKAEMRLTSVAYAAAVRDPDYALRFLSVRWRKRWNPRQRVELSGDPKRPLFAPPVNLSGVSDEELAKLEEIAKRVREPREAPRPTQH